MIPPGTTSGSGAGATSATAVALQVEEMVSRAWQLVRSTGPEALPGRPPAGASPGKSWAAVEKAARRGPGPKAREPERAARRQGQPISYHDLHATMLYLLGIDHTKLTYRFNGRNMRLTDVYGNVVRDLVA